MNGFSFAPVLLLLLLLILLGARGMLTRKPPRYCRNCGGVGVPVKKAAGTGCIELILWLCFLLPGLIYSIWRIAAAKETCKSCGASQLVPIDSPRGKSAITSLAAHGDMELTKRCPMCAELVLQAAVKCKHCGSAISTNDPSAADANRQPLS